MIYIYIYIHIHTYIRKWVCDNDIDYSSDWDMHDWDKHSAVNDVGLVLLIFSRHTILIDCWSIKVVFGMYSNSKGILGSICISCLSIRPCTHAWWHSWWTSWIATRWISIPECLVIDILYFYFMAGHKTHRPSTNKCAKWLVRLHIRTSWKCGEIYNVAAPPVFPQM